MSGTSMDGVDLALIKSDGENLIQRINFAYFPYDDKFKKALQSLIYGRPTLLEIKIIENQFTILQADIVNEFMRHNKILPHEIDAIGFSGHTILHAPEHKITWQIGNAELLAAKTKIKVISDFRIHDVALGGQGAPLVPVYHFYLLNQQKKPAIVLNIGGVSNITYFYNDNENDIEAFDVCFGNAPFDDLMRKKLGRDYDENGALTSQGRVDYALADRILQSEIFHKKPPKSFDRNDFAQLLSSFDNLQIQDALASFAYIHARAIQFNVEMLANHGGKPRLILVCGGGRFNQAIMNQMREYLGDIEIKPIDEFGFNGDAIEAEAFAFLSIRRMLNLPISFAKTTGRR